MHGHLITIKPQLQPSLFPRPDFVWIKLIQPFYYITLSFYYKILMFHPIFHVDIIDFLQCVHGVFNKP